MTTPLTVVPSSPNRPPSPRAQLRALLEAHPGDVVVTVPAPVGPPQGLLSVDAHANVWAPDGAAAEAGVGVARKVEASGPERFAAIAAAGEALFSGLEVVEQFDSSQHRLRAYGGFSFEPQVTEPWGDFQAAQFVLPRWTYRLDDHAASLTLVRCDAAPSDEDLLAEYDRIIAALTLPRPRAGAPALRRTDRSEDGFVRSVTELVDLIERGDLEKVVASRALVLEADRPLYAADVFEGLEPDRESACRFAFQRGDATFIGATPELLVRKRGDVVQSEALAGTARGDEAGELVAREKDRREHDLVVEHVEDRLRSVCSDVRRPLQPRLRKLRHLAHLLTPVSGQLAAPTHVMALAGTLHPTPAVGGIPVRAALDALATHGSPRGWYTGGVGWFDANGDGEIAVALRSGLVEERRVQVFVGAGIVAGSHPHRELQETELKARPLLSALGHGDDERQTSERRAAARW